MDHEACRDSLPLWVAGALGPAEDQAVQQHLAACGACRAERDAMTAAIDEFSTAAVAPDWTDQAAMRAAFRRSLPPVEPAPVRPLVRSRTWPVLWAATLLVALAGWGVAAQQGQRASAATQMIRLASAGQRAALTAATYRASQVDLYWQNSRALVWVRRLPPLASGQTYEGWWIVNGKPVAAGTFGQGPHLLTRPLAARAFAITVEPTGGTSQPTTPVLASTPI